MHFYRVQVTVLPPVRRARVERVIRTPDQGVILRNTWNERGTGHNGRTVGRVKQACFTRS